MLQSSSIVQRLINLPVFDAAWVLWLLIGLSIASVAVMVERFVFYRKHSVDSNAVRSALNSHLESGNFAQAADFLKQYDSLETNVVLFGLLAYRKGPEAVQDLLLGAESKERLRFSRRLNFLATVGSNAPFIGLFGTVLGIIRAFRDLANDVGNASGSVMTGISEALVATAVGLFVAIPAVIAYNAFQSRVKTLNANTQLLSRTLLSQLKSNEPSEAS
jgi:biopolymer transport protein ExbB/TolQ